MSATVFQALNLLLIAATLGSGLYWLRLLLAARRSPLPVLAWLVPMRPRARPFWTLADALLMFGIQLVLVTLLQQGLARMDWRAPVPDADAPPQLTPVAAAVLTILAGLGAMALSLTWLRWLGGEAFGRLALRPTVPDIWLGLKASILVLPAVLLLSGLIHSIFPYSHPVLDLLQQVDSVWGFAALFVATALVTPLVEEFLFRVLLQGGLQASWDAPETDEPGYQPRSYLPMWISSAVFALLHVGQGAAPIPLFVLALALGYLYRQTGRITAPLVVHMVLNSLTLVAAFTEPVGR